MHLTKILLLLLLSGCTNLHPMDAEMLHEVGFLKSSESIYMDAEELRLMLPKVAVVAEGRYRIPKVYEMPLGRWCGTEDRYPGNCQYVSKQAARVMNGYAFGTAWFRGRPGHMMNVTVVELSNGDIEVKYYEPQTCYWGKLDSLDGIAIGDV